MRDGEERLTLPSEVAAYRLIGEALRQREQSGGPGGILILCSRAACDSSCFPTVQCNRRREAGGSNPATAPCRLPPQGPAHTHLRSSDEPARRPPAVRSCRAAWALRSHPPPARAPGTAAPAPRGAAPLHAAAPAPAPYSMARAAASRTNHMTHV